MPDGAADRIRKYLCNQVEVARSKGEPRFCVAVSEIRDALGFSGTNSIIDICQVLDTQKFRTAAGVEFLCKPGPKQGVDTVYLFKIH